MNDISRLFRIRPSSTGKINAPTFAYKCVYGRSPITPIYPLYLQSRMYNGLYVDLHLQDEWLNDLNNIDNIEITSTCEGHDSNHITHIIFRPVVQDVKSLEMIKRKLNIGPTKCIFDIGNGGFYRVCVAIKNWYRNDSNNENWEMWWKTISKKIKESVKVGE